MEEKVTLIYKNGVLRPVLKILTDYPRDDLAHDEVHQALVTACVRRGVDAANIDVGAVPGLDTVSAGFKTAQLALNSKLGYGHVFHTNCAPRRNIASVKSAGEKIVLGMTSSGVAMLMVNAGYALAPFHESVKRGEAAFYQTSVPDAGSQFRSRDFFPDAMAELAAHLAARAETLGAAGVKKLLARGDFAAILKGLKWLGRPLDARLIPQLPPGAVLYVDNFGNIKLNFRHADLLKAYRPGEMLALKIEDTVQDVVMGREGFSQSEGMLALTSGSSGWTVEGKKRFFTEIMLRGAPAARLFGDFGTGDPATVLREKDLQKVLEILRRTDRKTSERLGLQNMSAARVIKMLARARLIRNGYDSTELRKALRKGDLIRRLKG